MDIVVFDARTLGCALGALRGLVGELSAGQARFVARLSELHGSSMEPSALQPLSAATVASSIVDAHQRERLVQLAILMMLVDGHVSIQAERAVVALARVLEVREPALRTLHHLARQRRIFVRLSVLRRIFGRFAKQIFRADGLRGVIRFAAALRGGGTDAQTAARYARLADYPLGSLGRALWDHCSARGFSLPGAPGAIPERVVFHDIGHVLAGYDTDPAGEIQQAAFQAGFLREDGFAFVFFGILQFHFGIKITPVAEGEVGHYDVDRILIALARGAACRADLSTWDFWKVAPQPLEQVRREQNIQPLVSRASNVAA